MKKSFRFAVVACVVLVVARSAAIDAAELHVTTSGNDVNPGTAAAALRTIQRAAELAQPGDVITVHAGVYRERVAPPRGGVSDDKRIVYQAAPGETVEIKGSEVVKNWVKVEGNVWKATVPNSLFGEFNPFNDLIKGDWFGDRGRKHHTGAVYLNGSWLIEATKLEEVLMPVGTAPDWLHQTDHQYLLNVAWLRAGGNADAPKIPATNFAANRGTQDAPCDEGGQCIGYITHGSWVRYDRFDFRERTAQIEIRAASASDGGTIEIRVDSPKGELLGSITVPNTGGWQTWSTFNAKIKPQSGVKKLCLVFQGPVRAEAQASLWFAQVEKDHTTIWAQFPGVDPNEHLVEINARQTVFYPRKPGINYITLRGFTMRHAATPWAPPTAEQIGLVGTHWSRGWIIENNTVSHSICSGIALGKYGDQWNNTSANSAPGYVETIQRALANGWNRETVGHHIVRNNKISHCEQTGVVGSLGGAFSEISGNHIHHIHVRKLFTGAEMAGIKLHAAVDTTIRGNHIHHTCLGIWLDWMAQGTRVSSNLFHDNPTDLFVEVNHGPYLVDNNLFLSQSNLADNSQGGAYVHNLFTGRIGSWPEPNRSTPYLQPHATDIAGMSDTKGGDDRFYNNLFIGRRGPGEKASQLDNAFGLSMFEAREFPLQVGGNVYYRGARPYHDEAKAGDNAIADAQVQFEEDDRGVQLRLTLDSTAAKPKTTLVTTERLGKTRVSKLPFENADGSPLMIDRDYFDKKRDAANPTAGPFENPAAGENVFKVWPKK